MEQTRDARTNIPGGLKCVRETLRSKGEPDSFPWIIRTERGPYWMDSKLIAYNHELIVGKTYLFQLSILYGRTYVVDFIKL